MFFISDAIAADTTEGMAGLTSSGFGSMAPLILIFVIFYFLLIRPQQKKLKDHRMMVENLKKGDKIVTSGGIVGVVQKVDVEPGVFLVEISPEVKVKVIKSSISEVLTRTPEAEKDSPKKPAPKKKEKAGNDN